MNVTVVFYSYFKDLAGRDEVVLEIAPGHTIDSLLTQVFADFPRLAEMRRSMLVAVGVEYQNGSYALKPGDRVSLFPPVQGG
jgi:MoaD family protein